MGNEINQLLMLAILGVWQFSSRIGPCGRKIARMTIDLHGLKIFWPESCICKHQALKVSSIVDDQSKNRFANGQNCRDLRVRPEP
jgi:hypothetical protein